MFATDAAGMSDSEPRCFGAISGVLGGYLVLHPRRRVTAIVFRFLTDIPAWVRDRHLVRVSTNQRHWDLWRRVGVGWCGLRRAHRRLCRRPGAASRCSPSDRAAQLLRGPLNNWKPKTRGGMPTFPTCEPLPTCSVDSGAKGLQCRRLRSARDQLSSGSGRRACATVLRECAAGLQAQLRSLLQFSTRE